MFHGEFSFANKNVHNFFEDNTRFTPGIEAWSRATRRMGFRMNTKEILILKGKRYDPTLTPGQTKRSKVSTKRYCQGRKSKKIHI